MSERDQEDVGQEEWIVPERDPERSETAARVASQLDRIMARQSGHFRVGDQHTGQIVSKELITAHPTFLGEVAGVIARRWWRELGSEVEVVVSASGGGSVLAYAVARALTGISEDLEVLAIHTKRRGGLVVLSPAFAKLVEGKRVLVVGRVLRSGRSMRAIADAVERAGGLVLGVSMICSRGTLTCDTLGVPQLDALLETLIPSWMPEDCPLCEEGVLPVEEL